LNSFIKRVAIAIGESFRGRPCDNPDEMATLFEGAAIAAVKAAREPTEAMLEASGYCGDLPREIWPAMIDEALEP
jgi:hypothetical protein